MQAQFGIRLELNQKLHLVDYHNGDGDFHFHSQIEICYVTEGKVDALVNDHLKRLKKGELSVALGYDTHRYLSVGDVRFTVLIVPPAFGPAPGAPGAALRGFTSRGGKIIRFEYQIERGALLYLEKIISERMAGRIAGLNMLS